LGSSTERSCSSRTSPPLAGPKGAKDVRQLTAEAAHGSCPIAFSVGIIVLVYL
jgi:hypothetical protein